MTGDDREKLQSPIQENTHVNCLIGRQNRALWNYHPFNQSYLNKRFCLIAANAFSFIIYHSLVVNWLMEQIQPFSLTQILIF